MRGVSLSDLHCSVARTLDVVGERWTLLVLRDAFSGATRFEEFAARLPVARNILTDRLRTLVAHDILERHAYSEHPPRYEYRLTRRGADLYPALISLLNWGDQYLAGADGPPVDLRHRDCGGQLHTAVVCASCGDEVTPTEAYDARRASRRAMPRQGRASD
jgi:DNA-binding HxlR family transcriptional regulator